jgi:two-component system, NtrC family, nitrogen regulation sensor histidine kinase NtrY
MNRSLDRWFSPNTSELRDDSTRVVLELAQYVTSNARVEAESIASSGAPDSELPALQDELSSRRITLAGGFAAVYGKDQRLLASFSGSAGVEPGQPDFPGPKKAEQGQAVSLHGPLTASACFPRRSAAISR